MLGELNGGIGDRVRVGITVAFKVPGENDNGRKVVEFCVKRGLCVGSTLSIRVCISKQRYHMHMKQWYGIFL